MSSPIIREVTIGDCRLIQGSGPEIIKALSGNMSAVIDPPYGIGLANGFDGFDGFGGFGKPIARRQYEGSWDNCTPTRKDFDAILSKTKYAIIFGGNYFTELLPKGSHWFVWDKKNTMPTFSDCELAWTNIPRKSVKLLTYEYNGLLGKREERVHPTQKPVEVMKWCIQRLPKDCGRIIDCYMGSGTTGVACVKLGRKFTGIELDPDYFDIAVERIRKAYEQPDMFVEVEKQKPAEQTTIDFGEDAA